MFSFKNFLSFEKLLTPSVIKVIYIIGLVVIVLGGITAIGGALFGYGGGFGAVLMALLGTAGALIGWRVYCELVIVLFGLYERAGEIRDRLPPRP